MSTIWSTNLLSQTWSSRVVKLWSRLCPKLCKICAQICGPGCGPGLEGLTRQLARRMLPNFLAKLYGNTLKLGVQKIVLFVLF